LSSYPYFVDWLDVSSDTNSSWRTLFHSGLFKTFKVNLIPIPRGAQLSCQPNRHILNALNFLNTSVSVYLKGTLKYQSWWTSLSFLIFFVQNKLYRRAIWHFQQTHLSWTKFHFSEFWNRSIVFLHPSFFSGCMLNMRMFWSGQNVPLRLRFDTLCKVHC
jgi:hypothetical protein